jgi:polygalacturonase
VDKVTVINPWDSPNTDGINPDSCRYVRISNCYVSVGDDCITIKSGTEKNERANLAPCEHIRLNNVEDAFVHGCRASAGTEAFLRLEGEKTSGVMLSGNHLSGARHRLVLGENVHADAVNEVGK